MELKEIDVTYLVEIICQIRCKNNGIKSHLSKEKFSKLDGVMINDTHLSFEYMREKSHMIDLLLDTIVKDILLKSRIYKLLNN